MKIVRFISGITVQYGQQIDARTARMIHGDIFSKCTITDQVIPIDVLLAPIVPTDILCIGVNYRAHAAESGTEVPDHPMLFIKGGNTLNHPFDPIPIPRLSNMIDFEGELAVVIGKTAKYVTREKALEYVLGYTIANDVTARDWQKDKKLGGGQFARGKSFDGFCPLGPHLVTRDEIPNPNALQIKTVLNTKVMQHTSTADMIFDVPALIASLSSTMTLRPGTVILTGTPSGVGMGRTPPVWMKPGDTITVEIDRIGMLENSVAAEV